MIDDLRQDNPIATDVISRLTVHGVPRLRVLEKVQPKISCCCRAVHNLTSTPEYDIRYQISAMATQNATTSIRASRKEPIDEVIRKLESNDDRSLKSLSMQRLQAFPTISSQPRFPTKRLLQALLENTTVENLELWLPEHNNCDVDTTTKDLFDSRDLFDLLSLMLATNKTIRRLSVLHSINDMGWNALIKGLHENDTISHLCIESSLPTCCLSFLHPIIH